MNTSTCATTDPRQYSRRSRQRRRAKQLQRRRMIVALIALGLAFFLGYLSGCGMQRARIPQTVQWMQDCCAYYGVPYALALAIALDMPQLRGQP